MLYSLSIQLYGVALRVAAVFHAKAKKWVEGRNDWRRRLSECVAAAGGAGDWLWVHCASLGEFEQGRNLIEAVRREAKDNAVLPQRILVTFFSPSGYEIRKNYGHADGVMYLPLDTPQNAADFIAILKPRLAVFVKYDLWLHFLSALRQQATPTVLISARMGQESRFLKPPFQAKYREAFAGMAAIFTQDDATAQLLRDFSGNAHVYSSGDTRYDRVAANRAEWKDLPEIATFIGNRRCVVCGSTWQADEEMLFAAQQRLAERGIDDICFILAPHEIHDSRMAAWEQKMPGNIARYSQLSAAPANAKTLFIDNIGMLSRLYAYATVAYVGGGFGSGLHNILEAAVFGCPVLYGNRIRKFPEAAALSAAGGGMILSDANALAESLTRLLSDEPLRQQMATAAEIFVQQQVGATEQIMAWVRANGGCS